MAIRENAQSWHPLMIDQQGMTIASSEITPLHKIGRKAKGLLDIPASWTLPFALISSELFDRCVGNHSLIEVENIVVGWNPQIRKALANLGFSDSTTILVRSSGVAEGIKERGSYYSIKGISGDIVSILSRCIHQIVQDITLGEESVGFVIQAYCQPKAKGHLSNERRCSQEARDWVGEIESLHGQNGHPFKISLRPWRDEVDHESFIESSLDCHLEQCISSSLKPVSQRYYITKGPRIHFEWVWDGSRIYLVQADEEYDEHGVDPQKIVTSLPQPDYTQETKVLEKIDAETSASYAKLKNVVLYRRLDLPTTTLFVLRDQETLDAIERGEISEDLDSDLRQLIRLPLVIRTDVNSQVQTERQLLPRSDEIRDLNKAKEWLVSASRKTRDGVGSSTQFVFIFHNFIPAISSAFAYAEPNQRLVQIEALWGLPEGLYYNSHDKYSIDTGFPELGRVLEKNSDFQGRERINYKHFLVAPDAEGQWTRQAITPPFDWRPSVSKKAWLKQIAIDSRKIAEAEGKAVSVMWFLGVSESVAPSGAMPWFHEQFDLTKLKTHSIKSRTKYSADQTFSVSVEDDIRTLENLSTEATEGQIKRIHVSPVDDKLLRNKFTLQAIGKVAKKIDATIVLEGAVLSHAYYQLASTGAVVEIVHPFIGFEERREFNKLVRDKVPLAIETIGESATTAALDQEGKLLALRDKLIEEAFEVKDAKDQDAIIEELADVMEVMQGILDCLGVDLLSVNEACSEKRRRRGAFNGGIVLLETNKPLPTASLPQPVFDLKGLDEMDSATATIGKNEYVRLAHKVDRSSDVRRGKGWREIKLHLVCPVSSLEWNSNTRELPIEGTNILVDARLNGKRTGDKLSLDLVVRIETDVPDLFSTAIIELPD